MELKITHMRLLGIIGVLLVIGSFFFFSNVGTNRENYSEGPQRPLKVKFAYLKDAKTNYCAGPEMVQIQSDEARLQGSCCNPMDLHRYEEQVEGLKKYSSIDKVPSDPYDIPVSLAKELLEYQKSIQLTAEQQQIYDDAMKMSHEGGPCCCKCWRWDAFEGLAKYLITEHGFDAKQVAEVWDIADGCGGKGHAHGETT